MALPLWEVLCCQRLPSTMERRHMSSMSHISNNASPNTALPFEGVGTPVYATKAFLCTAFAELLAESGWWADVVSLGEAENVRRGGVGAERILLHGNLKTDEELSLAVRGDVAIIVIDSLGELDRLISSASASDVVVDVMIRLNEDLHLATHPKVLTSGEDAKFGARTGRGHGGRRPHCGLACRTHARRSPPRWLAGSRSGVVRGHRRSVGRLRLPAS